MTDEISTNTQQKGSGNKSENSDFVGIEKKTIKAEQEEAHTPGNNKKDSTVKSEFKRVADTTKLTDVILAFATVVIAVFAYMQWCALEKTDATARLRDRAFLYFFTPTFEPYPSKENPTEYVIKIFAQNSGNMPAQHVDIQYACIDSPTQIFTAPVQQAKWEGMNTPKTLGPKQDFGFQLFKVTINRTEFENMVRSGVMGKFILAEAKYFDGFSTKQRVTKMGVRLNVDTSGAHSFFFTTNHNCTDDYCPKE
jgi:hypothetical protein